MFLFVVLVVGGSVVARLGVVGGFLSGLVKAKGIKTM